MNNEPVAFRWKSDLGYIYDVFNHGNGEPLYTHPAKELIEEKSYEVVFDGEKYTTKLVEPKVKELTDEEIDAVWFSYKGDIKDFARAILRKAQEK